MRAPAALLVVLLSFSCATTQPAATASSSSATFEIRPSRFEGWDGCALVYDAKAQRVVATYGEERCRQRYVACSTFKWPLAVMAFDAGILEDENTLFKWDGVHHSIESWNQDHTAASWMRHSVVWYSQRITPLLGRDRVQSYLKAFDYGNQDFSGGLGSAWLTITKTDSDPGKGSLKITAFEQLEFMKKFWAGQLPVSAAAIEKTKKVLYLDVSPTGYVLHGKTGSGYLEGLTGDFGWFIGHVEGNGREYFVVTTFTRTERAADARFPGLLARDVTKAILKDNGVW